MMRLKGWHCLAILFLVVISAYWPALNAGYNSVDDLKMISAIQQGGALDLKRLFVLGETYYYRPLTILSYTLDRDVWGLIASFMHLENILLHLFCAWLVFGITRQLQPLWTEQRLWPALLAGFLFGLHPLAVESVAWISGRTDILMTLFVLLAVWLTLLGLAKESSLAILGAGIALFLAPLAKETAVFVLPGLLWLILVYPESGSWSSRLRGRWQMLLATLGGIAGYFLLRFIAIGRDTGVQTALKGVVGQEPGIVELLDKVRIAFKVYGFYFKKLLLPWPLNFGIVEISDWYVLLGILLAFILISLAWRADVPGAFGLMAFCALSPALLVVYGRMTWTPIAERYAYCSVALFAPLATWAILRLRQFFAYWSFRYWVCLPVGLLVIFFVSTIHRAWIWQDNIRLYADTAAKSPAFAPAKAELAAALQHQGRNLEATEILSGMQSSDPESRYINDDINLAMLLLADGDIDGAHRLTASLLEKNPKQRFEVLQLLLRINDWRIGQASDAEARLAIQRQSIKWLEEQQSLRPSAFIVYRIGKMQLSMGEEASALESFKMSLSKTPDDAHYRGALKTFINRLEGP